MKLGHVDGKNRIYDPDGNLILQPSEKLLGKYENVFLDISKAWRVWFVDSIFPGEAGRVVCYLTNRRIVFIRRPDVHKAGAYLMTPYGATQAIADRYKARMILKAGGFEYCEISADNFRFYKKFRTGLNLLLNDDGQKYGAFIMTKDKSVSPELHPALLSWLESKGISRR